MSEPPPHPTLTPPPPHYPTTTTTSSYKNHHIHGGATATTTTPTTTTTIRDYRKGNWTPDETLILITAKKLDDERRINAAAATTTSTHRTGGGELRWKWVENYCWNNGCFRSQNQCNDKWDNLLRDYKKVRDYELMIRSPARNQNHCPPSYWVMDKQQRKHRNLPSNLLQNIYEALNDVVHRKHLPQKTTNPYLFHQQQQQMPLPIAALPPPPPPPPLPPPVEPPPPPPPSPAAAAGAASGSGESQGDEAEKVDSETKRRRVRDEDVDDIGSIIIQSTKLLSQTLKEHEDNQEKRHNQLIELQQQRLQLEETRNQVNHQGIAALITSIDKLSDAIHTLISQKPK